MSFDINPLGNSLYLREIEREVSEIRAFQAAAVSEAGDITVRPSRRKSWIARAFLLVRRPGSAGRRAGAKATSAGKL
jgi:hypothetical protein